MEATDRKVGCEEAGEAQIGGEVEFRGESEPFPRLDLAGLVVWSGLLRSFRASQCFVCLSVMGRRGVPVTSMSPQARLDVNSGDGD